MFRHLPSINQLRAFEASARYLSFTKAAEELFLTQSAISHQINSLEGIVRQKLFVRRNRRLILTPAGHELRLTAQKILPQLQRTVDKIRSGGSHKKITISTLPSIAGSWLVQKLASLRSAFPEIDLMVLASENPENFVTDVTIDFAIHFSHPNAKGLWQKHIMDEFYLPICAPDLLSDPELPLHDVQDLQHHTLIHQDDTLGWEGWFAYHNLEGITPKHILSFNHGDLAIQATIEGQGVALARALMVQRALEQGLLVSPFEMPLPTRRKYYVLAPPENIENPIVMQIIDWLCAAAQQDQMHRKTALP